MTVMLKNSRLLDARLFPAFVAAAELQNFTQAADAAHMTQSGVSQHIAKLEEQIGRPLFKRLGKAVCLTRAGEVLLGYIRDQIVNVNDLFERIQVEEEAISGLVSYAMPPSCLLSGHFTKLLERRQHHRDLRLRVVTAASSEVLQMVLRDEVDFGFLTAKPEHAAVTFEPFCDEEYVLVGSEAWVAGLQRADNIFRTPVVIFPGSEDYYERWLQHHLPESRKGFEALLPVGEINSIEGAIMMVTGGVGCGVFPRHCVQQQITAGLLSEYQGAAGILSNPIYVARVANYRPTKRVQCVLDWFLDMLADERKATPVPSTRRAAYGSDKPRERHTANAERSSRREAKV